MLRNHKSPQAATKAQRAKIHPAQRRRRVAPRVTTTTARPFSTAPPAANGTGNPQGLIRTTLTDGKFYSKLASGVLEGIVERIEAEDIDYQFDNEIEYSSDVLKFKTPRGTWVLNKHNVTKQIWLSSPISGPSKYNYHPPNFVWERDHNKVWGEGEGLGGVWLCERNDTTKLSDLLQTEWSQVFGMDVKFQQDF